MAKKCIKCGFELNDGDMFCGECGTPQPQPTSSCPNCGTEIVLGTNFCSNCGAPLKSKEPVHNSHVATSTAAYPDCEVTVVDANTVGVNIKGVTFNMKLVEGGMMDKSTELSDFYIGETVVTQELWEMVMGDNPSEDNRDLQLPVTGMNIALCNAFFVQLQKLTGCTFGFPTIHQWQYAHNGGRKSAKRTKFAGSDNVDEVAWTKENSNGKIQKVGMLRPNELGLYDMDGNVQEYCIGTLEKTQDYKFNPLNAQTANPFGLSVSSSPKGAYSLTGLRTVINIPVPKSILSQNTSDNSTESLKACYPPATSPLYAIILRQQQLQEPRLLSEIEKRKKEAEQKAEAEAKAQQEYEESLRFHIVYKGKHGFLDRNGRTVIPCRYDEAGDFHEGMAWVKDGRWYGYIDVTGRKIIPCDFFSASDFCEGLAYVGDGFIDKTGKEIFSCRKYSSAQNFSCGLAIVEVHRNLSATYGFIDKTGKEVIPTKYGCADSFSEGLARVVDDGKSIYIDKKGHTIISDVYGREFHDGLAYATINLSGKRKTGFIDKTGHMVIPLDSNNDTGDFHEGMVSHGISKEYGFLDRNGQESIPCMYEYAGDFSEGLAFVKQKGKYGFIDKTGKIVIPCKFEYAYNFKNGLAYVLLKGKYGYIDKIGNKVSSFKYEEYYSL